MISVVFLQIQLKKVILCIGIAMFLIGGVKKLRWDKEVVKYLRKQEKIEKDD